jgi:uncharacterized protein YqgQ
LLGIGGIAGGYIAYLLDKKKEREFKVLEQKERRYKSCLLYMNAFFEPKNFLKTILIMRQDLSAKTHDLDLGKIRVKLEPKS